MIWVSCRDCSENAPYPLVPFPGGRRDMDGTDQYAMESNALHTIPIHSIANAFQWTGMDTNGIDTYALVALNADAVLRVVARHDRMVTAGLAA